MWKLWQKFSQSRPLAAATVRKWAYGQPHHLAVDAWLHNEFENMVAKGQVPVMRSFDGGCNAPTGFDGYYATKTLAGHLSRVGGDNLEYALSRSFVDQVRSEQTAVEVRIQMRFPEVYAEIDRLKVEGELRLSIFWPLVFLITLLGWHWSPFALALLLLPPFLLRDGYARIRQASEKTWAPLVAGEVTTPTLDAMADAREQKPGDFGDRFKHWDEGTSTELSAVS